MDIVKAFTDNLLSLPIHIRGTHHNPLFRASDIGEILEIVAIRNQIENFRTPDDKVFEVVPTNGGEQKVIFLTERGLYKVLFKCNKPVAQRFQDWVCDVIKEIRLTGEYTLKKQLELEQEEKRKLEDEKMKLENEIERLQVIDGTPVMYIYNTDARNGTTKQSLLKIGVTEHFWERSKPYGQTHPYGKMVFSAQIPSGQTNLKTVENFIFNILSQYRIQNEMFTGLEFDEAQWWFTHITELLRVAHMSESIEKRERLAKITDATTNILNKPSSNVATVDCAIQVDLDLDDSHRQPSAFDKFIEECCIVNDNAEVHTTEIAGMHRIWAKKVDMETYHALLDYLKTRFKPIRLAVQDHEGVAYGYRGVTLKDNPVTISLNPSDMELFVYHNCKYEPGGKVLMADLKQAYQDWKRHTKRSITPSDATDLRKFLANCNRVLFANIWLHKQNGQGYYGLILKGQVMHMQTTSSTAKKVQCRTMDHTILESFSTIAKAAILEGVSAAKMSRLLRAGKAVFGEHYYTCSDS